MKLAIATGITFLALANPSLAQTLPPFPFNILIDNFHVIEAYKERIPPTLIDTADTWAIEGRWLYQEPLPKSDWFRFVDCQTSWGFEVLKLNSDIPGGTPSYSYHYDFPRSYDLSDAGMDEVSRVNHSDIPAKRKEVWASTLGLDEEIDRRDLCRYMGLTPGF